MGTRADFYVGRGTDAEWLGSIAWDGYPDGVFNGTREDKEYLPSSIDDEQWWRTAVAEWLSQRDDRTLPEQGWPWPWDDSNTTDYAYAFDAGKVWGNGFGHGWFVVAEGEPRDDKGERTAPDEKPTPFPNMADRKNVRMDRGSGLIVIPMSSQ